MASRVEWARRVGRWKKSGLSARELGRREGFDGGQLSWWKWRLGADERSRRVRCPPAVRRSARAMPAFVPARLVGEHVAEPRGALVEIALSNGRVVRVLRPCDAELLARVLEVASRAGS